MDNESKDGITTQVATNLDPITGAAGAHPVGVGLGAAVGGIAAGAAAGTVAAGPLGTVIGAAVGAIAGGLGGKAVAEHFDPTLAGTTPSEDDLRTTSLPAWNNESQLRPGRSPPGLWRTPASNETTGCASAQHQAQPRR